MAGEVGKAVITDRSALSAKYGDGFAQVVDALDRLVEADAGRGITTELIEIDDPIRMGELNAPAVTDPGDPQQAKVAVDAVFAALNPSYLMLLGSTDVVPSQPMENPMFSPDGDPDPSALGDLPYACDAPYGTSPAAFVGPTRVVGRLPDVTGGSDPAYLVGLLSAASDWEPAPRDDYLGYLGISARVWQGSTSLSLKNLFGASDDLRLSPAEGPAWSDELLGRRVHFINCHGAEADSHFYGQEGGSYPVAHDAGLVAGHLTPGTVAAAECCYGAQLYDPRPVGGVPGLCNTYLAGGAFGFFGSSTIAYGPAEGNGSADLLCQYFLRHVLEGASLGRAALEARQDFVENVTVVDPADLKTLAQFDLMGDPSVHPVLPTSDEEPVAADDRQKRLEPSDLRILKGRTGRRARLADRGNSLARSKAVARSSPETEDAAAKIEEILRLAGVTGLTRRALRSFGVTSPSPPGAKSFSWTPPSGFHVVVGREDESSSPVRRVTAVLAKEVGGRIVSVRKLYGK